MESLLVWLPVLYRPVEHSGEENRTCRQRHSELLTSTVKVFASEDDRNDLSFVPGLSGQALGSVSDPQTVWYIPNFSSNSVKGAI